jgi:hypothetical protein
MSIVGKIVRELREHGIELSVTQKRYKGAWVDKIAWRAHEPLPKEALATIKENREALIRWLNLPATEDDLAALTAATGRTDPSPLLTRGEARLLSLLPPPTPATPWERLISDFYTGRECDPIRPWENDPATAGQRAYTTKLTGATPPEGATKGECSYVIGRAKKGLPL